MAHKVNLTERNKDYLCGIPCLALVVLYDRTISRYPEQGDSFFPRTDPLALKTVRMGVIFQKQDAYYTYKWGLYSAGHAQLDLSQQTHMTIWYKVETDKTLLYLVIVEASRLLKVLSRDWANFKSDDSPLPQF